MGALSDSCAEPEIQTFLKLLNSSTESLKVTILVLDLNTTRDSELSQLHGRGLAAGTAGEPRRSGWCGLREGYRCQNALG
jgi:hypothetical protein